MYFSDVSQRDEKKDGWKYYIVLIKEGFFPIIQKKSKEEIC